MQARLTYEGTALSSLRQINALPEPVKRALYSSLIPLPTLTRLCTAPVAEPAPCELAIQVRAPQGTCFVEIDVRHPGAPRDPVLYVHMADTASGQIEVLLVQANDPRAPRFDIDRDWQGETTKLGTFTRHIPAEIAALQAGLAPGQVRQGLGLSRHLIPVMEQFVASLNKDRFFIEPLAYHNALMFERYGFAYMTGQPLMIWIDRQFQPGGELDARLDGATPFRQPGAGKTIRGRSWAIHDGILGHPWGNVRMYKRVGHHARICTFPNAQY